MVNNGGRHAFVLPAPAGRISCYPFTNSPISRSGDTNKREWVKAVLEEMLVEINEYDNKGANLSDEEAVPEISKMTTEILNEKPAEAEVTGANNNGGKPIFVITPAPSPVFPDEAPIVGPVDVVIGLHGSDSDSTSKMPNGMRSRDSKESLIPEQRKERWYTIMSQVALPYLIAGLGMVGAGVILNIVKDWEVFQAYPELLVLVTPLLGLKGNLEMTLASRLSTHANLGQMKTWQAIVHICLGNLALTQLQALVVGALASVVAMSMAMKWDGTDDILSILKNGVIICASSVLTASSASLLLGLLMVAVIILSIKLNVNPDNIATPIAASLGDVTTLGLLAWIATALHQQGDATKWISCLIIGCLALTTPFWLFICWRNEYTKPVLRTGWTPVLCAMVLSSGGGMILDFAEHRFPTIALYQPLYNGVGGNLASVQASRICTSLHKYCSPGSLPDSEVLPGGRPRVWLSPWSVFTKQGVHSVSARVLLGMVAPGHIIFVITSYYLSGHREELDISFLFFFVYITAALIQVVILLYLTHVLINWFWVHKIDPDTSAIPYLTALGDLIGSGLLLGVYQILYTSTVV